MAGSWWNSDHDDDSFTTPDETAGQQSGGNRNAPENLRGFENTAESSNAGDGDPDYEAGGPLDPNAGRDPHSETRGRRF